MKSVFTRRQEKKKLLSSYKYPNSLMCCSTSKIFHEVNKKQTKGGGTVATRAQRGSKRKPVQHIVKALTTPL